jgi:hypothetical protein
MRYLSAGLIGGIVCIVFAAMEFVSAEPCAPFELPKQFSAVIASGGKVGNNTAKVYVDNNKSRTEFDNNGSRVIQIGRGDLKVMYTILPSKKQYSEIPLSDEQARSIGTQTDSRAQWENLGAETIGGKKCDKYRVTTPASNDLKPAVVSLLYVDSAEKVPVRTIVGEGVEMVTVDYTSFKKGAQDSSLFEPPKEYMKIVLPVNRESSP